MDGKPKRKWLAWDKVYMPVKEGGFFRTKYIKDKRISQVDTTKGSRFLKMVMSCMPDVLK